jgi:predicted nucleic acid-binding protein
MLFDTSVWIDYSHNKSTRQTDLLFKKILNDDEIFICPPIYQEFLQGIRSDNDYDELVDLMLSLKFLALDPYFAAHEAASIFRKIRRAGVTIRKSNDCLIAFYAIHFKAALVHNDKDFDKIAKHTSLKIYST